MEGIDTNIIEINDNKKILEKLPEAQVVKRRGSTETFGGEEIVKLVIEGKERYFVSDALDEVVVEDNDKIYIINQRAAPRKELTKDEISSFNWSDVNEPSKDSFYLIHGKDLYVSYYPGAASDGGIGTKPGDQDEDTPFVRIDNAEVGKRYQIQCSSGFRWLEKNLESK